MVFTSGDAAGSIRMAKLRSDVKISVFINNAIYCRWWQMAYHLPGQKTSPRPMWRRKILEVAKVLAKMDVSYVVRSLRPKEYRLAKKSASCAFRSTGGARFHVEGLPAHDSG
jgi:hypothetical protein